MSKIKDQILRDQDLQMEYYFKFMDKMYEELRPEPKLSESDIEKMESSYANSSKPLINKSAVRIPTRTSNLAETNISLDVRKDVAWE